MGKSFHIILNSLRLTFQELRVNKLRTILSLTGIAFGIFCIIGVLTAVNSLERNIQNEVKSLGTNTIYIDKWDYSAGGGPDYPWWKFVKRPAPKFDEIKQIKERTPSAKYVAFNINANDNVEYADNSLSGVNLYGISEEFQNIQPVDVAYGRYITESEFDHGSPVILLGNEVAEKLFVSPEIAVGKLVQVRGKKVQVIVIADQIAVRPA